jgi:hypothetical protein
MPTSNKARPGGSAFLEKPFTAERLAQMPRGER